MTIRKSITAKALIANRENSKRSTGPRTPDGKQRSGGNAATHGFYSQELQISAADRPEFDALRAKLSNQLEADTPLEELGRERVIACAWRAKQGTPVGIDENIFEGWR